MHGVNRATGSSEGYRDPFFRIDVIEELGGKRIQVMKIKAHSNFLDAIPTSVVSFATLHTTRNIGE